MRFIGKSLKSISYEYAYDTAGRMTREGAKTYRYGYLDKVLSVAEGKERRTFTYHADGQLATATNGKETEDFLWDGLALIRRGSTAYVTPRLSKNNPSQQAWYGLKKNCSHYI